MDRLRAQILSKCSIQDLTLDPQALKRLCDFLEPLSDPLITLSEVLKHLSEESELPITLSVMENAIAKIQKLAHPDPLANEGDYFEVQNAFQVPHMFYDASIKRFQYVFLYYLKQINYLFHFFIKEFLQINHHF